MSEVDEADSAAAAVVLEGEDDPDTDLTKRFLLPGALNMDYAFDAAIQDEVRAGKACVAASKGLGLIVCLPSSHPSVQLGLRDVPEDHEGSRCRC